MLASLLVDDSIDAHAEVASALAEEVDREVRRRLMSAGATVIGRRPGRRTVPQAWAAS